VTITRKIWLILITLGALLLGSTIWLIGTSSGARWALARAGSYLPDELIIGDIQGSLLGGLRIDSVQWLDDSVRISTDDIYLDFELIPLLFSYLDVNELNVARFDIEILESGEPDTAPGLPTIDLPIDISIASAHLRNATFRTDSVAQIVDEIRFAGSLFGSDLSITQMRLVSSKLDLDLNGRVKLADFYAGRARVAWRWVQSDEFDIAGELQLEGDTRLYNLRNLLTVPVAISTSGSVSLDSGALLADLTNEWESLGLQIRERNLYSSTGTLRLRGSVDSYEVDLDAYAKLDDVPETRIELDGDADRQTIQISHLRVVNEIADLSGSGNASWAPEQTFDLDFSLSGLDPSRISPTVSGNLEFDGYVAAFVREQAPEIDLRIDRIGGNVNGRSLAGDALVAYAGNILAVTEARIQLGSNSTEFKGSLGETISLDADLDLVALSEIVPEAAGALRGNVVISGSKGHPDARVDLTGAALRWKDNSASSVSVVANIFQADRSFAELTLQQVSIGKISLDTAQLSASGLIDGHNIRVSLNGYDSELAIDAEGGFLQDLWSGRIDSLTVANAALGRWSSRQSSELQVSVDEIAVSETCLYPPSDPGRACLGGGYKEGDLASLDFSLGDVPLSAIPVALPGDVNLSGFVDARLQLESRERRLTGHAGIDLRQAMVDATYDGESIAVAFSDAVGEATILDNRIDSTLRLEMTEDAGAGNLQLSIHDLSDLESAIAGQGNLSINDVSLVAVFLPGISNPQGKVEGSLTVSGTLTRPEFLGEVALSEGGFSVRQTGIEIADIGVRLSQRAPGQLHLVGSARSGSGQISIEGDTLVGTDSGIRTEIVLTGEDFELARLPEWQVAASPSITAIFDERATLVSGELGIPTANIILSEIPETAESPSPDAIVHRIEGTQAPTGRRLSVDVRTTLGDDVRFSGFGLTAGVEGTVRLQGGNREPWVGNGTLVLRGGRYKAYGQELEIERGELLFNGPLDNPQLDIRAIRRTNDVVAGIHLSGTPSQLRSDVFSDPALSDAEALSYLLTGRPLSSSANAGQGDVLNNAAFALGLTGAGTVASQVRSGLGLETLTVEGGSDSGRIVAGKRIGNRLLVEYGYGLIDKLGTLLLRYQLSDRIVLESRTGTVSNLDVLYSVKKQ
jgi:translocation and assembly module TamB